MSQPNATTGTEGKHQRINERLKDYWEELRQGRVYPSEREIDPNVIQDIWDACFLIRVNGDVSKKGFKYTYLGLSLIEAYGDDLTGLDVCDRLVSPTSEQMSKKIHEVMESTKPVMDDSSFTNRKNMLVKYRSVMLPLGSSPEEVDYIIGGMKWKAY